MKVSGRFRLFLSALFLAAMATSCGRVSELESDQTYLFNQAVSQHLGDSALANPEAQAELRLITSEINSALLTALLPEYEAQFQAAYGKRPANRLAAAPTGCKPKIKILMIGLGIEFTPSATCKLDGTIGVKLFPITAVADLDVVGLKHIQRIQFDANVALGGSGSGVNLNLVFLDARVSLGNVPLLPIQNVVAVGSVALQIAPGVFKLNSRVNAFEGSTGMGVALVTKVDRAIDVRDIQGCLLTGGVPTNPNGGTLNSCFRIGGG